MADWRQETLAGRRIPAGRLVTARSHLIDRFRADCEIVLLPERQSEGETLSWRVGPQKAATTRTGWRRKVRAEAIPDDRWFLDLRANAPENWAHVLNNHLPLAFHLSERSGLSLDRLTALLPRDVPGYVRAAVRLFGPEVLATDAAVSGAGVAYKVQPWRALRGARAAWVARADVQARLAAALAATPAGTTLPRKVFLSRRDSRRLKNEDQIADTLSQRGFHTVYPEALSPLDQFRLFREAEEIVAVHGAGLAPLLYCQPGQGPRRMVEILSPGHMTDVYREMCGTAGTAWIGVRGRLEPKHVAAAYDLDTPYTAHSTDDFEVDPSSLDLAFELLETPA